MCPICNKRLTHIVYSKVDDYVLEGMHTIGQIILVKSNAYVKAPRSYCTKCHTGYDKEVALDNTLKN